MKEIDRFAGHEPGLEIIIQQDESNSELYKKCIYKNEIELLKVGENTYNNRINKLDIHFPFVIFDVLETKKYGIVIDCMKQNNFWSYYGLTCDPQKLKLIKSNYFDEAIGCHRKEEIYKCPTCFKIWQINEEYDTHHGYNRQCKVVENV